MQDTAARRVNMVNSQILTNRVSDERITEAMLAVPRETFVPKAWRGAAYVDEDIPLGNGRYLMEPMVFARLLQAAEIDERTVVLDVASGAGYSAAVLARLAGTVVALEDDDERVRVIEERLSALGIDNAAVVKAGLKDGYPAQAPFDVIFVNGAVEVMPDALKEQLAEGGRLLAVERSGPVGRAVLYTRIAGLVGRRELFDAQLPVLPGFEKPAAFTF